MLQVTFNLINQISQNIVFGVTDFSYFSYVMLFQCQLLSITKNSLLEVSPQKPLAVYRVSPILKHYYDLLDLSLKVSSRKVDANLKIVIITINYILSNPF